MKYKTGEPGKVIKNIGSQSRNQYYIPVPDTLRIVVSEGSSCHLHSATLAKIHLGSKISIGVAHGKHVIDFYGTAGDYIVETDECDIGRQEHYFKIVHSIPDKLDATMPNNASLDMEVASIIPENDDASTRTEVLPARPNPFQDYLDVPLPTDNEPVSISILNALGEVIYSNEASGEEFHRVNSSEFRSGMYILIRSQAGLVTKDVLVKE